MQFECRLNTRSVTLFHVVWETCYVSFHLLFTSNLTANASWKTAQRHATIQLAEHNEDNLGKHTACIELYVTAVIITKWSELYTLRNL